MHDVKCKRPKPSPGESVSRSVLPHFDTPEPQSFARASPAAPERANGLRLVNLLQLRRHTLYHA